MPRGEVQPLTRRGILALAGAALLSAARAGAQQPSGQEKPVKILALGDSLTAGYGLPASDAFPAKLQAALKARGVAADIVNAGVSGDTASDGLARLDWALSPDTDAAIVELGANDMLRGVDPAVTRKALAAILDRLRRRHVATLLCGMIAAPNLGRDYADAFNAMYPDLAKSYGALYYPFFLDGVATVRALIQPDGMHPTAAGIDAIVERILPSVQELVARARDGRT